MQRSNGWTGGQYSLYRAVLGIALGALCLGADAPLLGRAAAGVLALLLALGVADRIAAAALWFVVAWQTGGRGLESVPMAFLWCLLLHLGTPERPYGTWSARGRLDPGGGWHMPALVATLAWLGLAVGHAAAAVLHPWNDALACTLGTLRILGALGLFLRPSRFPAWLALAMLVVAEVASGAYGTSRAATAIAWLLLHLAAFDPAWLPPRRRAAPLQVFYDGHCGLCHRFVRFCLAEDPTGDLLRFAPLQGDTFAAAVPAAQRADLPDSVVVQVGDGPLCVRSTAALMVLDTLGGLWRVVAAVLWLVPRPLRDLGYDGIAKIRRRLFAPPADACPILPPTLRSRFGP